MDFILNNRLVVNDFCRETGEAIKALLTMPNPAYLETEKHGRWAGNIPAKLKFYQDSGAELTCPRGAARQIYEVAQRHGENINLIDKRRVLAPADFHFNARLRDFQQKPVRCCLGRDFGVLVAPTGSGKTVMALFMVAMRRQPALIVVHTVDLMRQWQERIKQFLGAEAGIIGDGQFVIRPITVATVQTLVKHAADVSRHFGYLILDEVHRAAAMQYAEVIGHFDCKYMTGLSATAFRRDGLSKVIFWHVGDVTGGVEKAELLKTGNLCPAQVVWTETGFWSAACPSTQYSRALSQLAADSERNQLICHTIANNTGGGIALVLTDRKKHCHALAGLLQKHYGIEASILTGDTKDREAVIDHLHRGRCKVLIATGQLVGEGFDLPAISSMFLATPIKFSGRLIQYVGRALRLAPGKRKAFIYDFIDQNPVFKASAKSRARTYQKQGIENIQNPKTAMKTVFTRPEICYNFVIKSGAKAMARNDLTLSPWGV